MCPPDFRGGGFSGRGYLFRTFAHFGDHNPPSKPRNRSCIGSSASGTAPPPATSLLLTQKGSADKVPLGRALLFLNKEKGAGGEVWESVLGGVKLVVNGETYCYGQFLSNPGPLRLARMAPENIEVPEAIVYGEELLLKDLRSALEKAKGLKKPDHRSALEEAVRKGPKGK